MMFFRWSLNWLFLLLIREKIVIALLSVVLEMRRGLWKIVVERHVLLLHLLTQYIKLF